MGFFGIFIFIIVVLFGLSVGSFLNVVILRFDDFETILKGRSHCPHCKKILKWYELIPLFSYLFLVGRCFTCKKTISLQYPLVEASTALTFLLIYLNYNISWASLILAIVFSLLIVISAYDILHSEIPDILSYLLIFFGLFWTIYHLTISRALDLAGFLPYIYAVLIGAGFFGFLVLVSRQKWMGAGDILLGAFMGIFLGMPQVLISLFLAFTIGAVFSLFLIAFGKKTMKDALPFGPFLALATVIAFFWGEKLLNYYWYMLM